MLSFNYNFLRFAHFGPCFLMKNEVEAFYIVAVVQILSLGLKWSQNYDLEAHCLYIVDDLIVSFSAVLFLTKVLFNA